MAEPLHPLVVAGEVLGVNVLFWSLDYYGLNKSYAETGPSYWNRNFRDGWKWDHNHWAVNFFGHPMQGLLYYEFARSGGYGFYGSLAFAALGSSTWEMFAETEYPSPNDLILTSVGGSVYGEVFYRISRMLYGTERVPWYRELGSAAFNPPGYLQRRVFGDRDGVAGNAAMDLSLFVGMGSRFVNVFRFGNDANYLDEDESGKHALFGMKLEYGRPYAKVIRPFDYFNLYVVGKAGSEDDLFHVDVTGKLANASFCGNEHNLDFAVYLDYDTFYGDFVTIGTVSLGGGVDFAIDATEHLRFRIKNQMYWVMLGTTDMGYDDVILRMHPEYESDKDNYQYNMGLKYTLTLDLLVWNRLTFANKTNVDALRTMPNSLPHYGAYGWDFLIFNYTSMEYAVTSWLSFGLRMDAYVKFAAYSSEIFEPMSRSMLAGTLYMQFKIL